MKTIVLASNNAHKVKEFQEMFPKYQIQSLKDIGFQGDIVEDGTTFLENALIKARTISQYLKEQGKDVDVISDDSGLCVNALGGAPGIHSARYAGDHTDEGNREKLRKELKDKKDRSAYYFCQIVLLHPDGTYEEFSGKTEGEILMEEKGKKDFCYDCMFYSNDLKKTFGEATDEEKNSVSHRGRAIQELKKELC